MKKRKKHIGEEKAGNLSVETTFGKRKRTYSREKNKETICQSDFLRKGKEGRKHGEMELSVRISNA